jgi:hypothetical protein
MRWTSPSGEVVNVVVGVVGRPIATCNAHPYKRVAIGSDLSAGKKPAL